MIMMNFFLVYLYFFKIQRTIRRRRYYQLYKETNIPLSGSRRLFTESAKFIPLKIHN